MSVAALNNVWVLSWRDQASQQVSEFLAAASSRRVVLTQRNPVDRTVLSWPLAPRGYLGRLSASFVVQRRKKREHRAQRDRMELSRSNSFGRGHCLKTIRERTGIQCSSSRIADEMEPNLGIWRISRAAAFRIDCRRSMTKCHLHS